MENSNKGEENNINNLNSENIDNQNKNESKNTNIIKNPIIDNKSKIENNNVNNINKEIDNILNLENKEKILNDRLKEIESFINYFKNNRNNIIIQNKNNLNQKSVDNINFLKENKINDKKNSPSKIKYKNNNINNFNKDIATRNSYFLNTEKNNDKKKINFFDKQNSIRNDNKNKYKIFNRLFEDAKKRNKVRNSVNKLNKDFISVEKINKRYNNSEWNKIYNKRFKSYQEKIDKKREESIRSKEREKKKKEDEILNYSKSKKAPMKHIIESSQKMYEEAERRKLRLEEKKLNMKDLNDTDDSVYKYMTNINFGTCNLDKNEEEKIEYKNNISNKLLINNYNDYKLELKNKNQCNNKKINLKKGKKFTVSKLNNKRFEKKFQINKINNKSLENNRYVFNNNYTNSDDKKADNNILYIDGKSYNLEEERKELLQMAEHKNLYGRNINNEQLKNENENNNSFRKTYNFEADKLIFEFFMRQLDW